MPDDALLEDSGELSPGGLPLRVRQSVRNSGNRVADTGNGEAKFVVHKCFQVWLKRFLRAGVVGGGGFSNKSLKETIF